MSAAARDNRGHDNVVPINAAAADEWDPAQLHPETVAARWNTETQLLGALMWLPATEVQAILRYVQDDDFERPTTRWAIELIRALAAAGQDPNPVLIVRAAQKQQPNDETSFELRTRKIGGQGGRYHQLTMHVANAYTDVVGYGTTAWHYAAEVLDDSYRRAFRDHGIRMQHMAEAMADVEDLTDYATGYFRGNLRDIWTRRNQLIKHRTADSKDND